MSVLLWHNEININDQLCANEAGYNSNTNALLWKHIDCIKHHSKRSSNPNKST